MHPEPTRVGIFEYFIWTVFIKISSVGGFGPHPTPWFISCYLFIYSYIFFCGFAFKDMLASLWKMCSIYIEFSNFCATLNFNFQAPRTKILRTLKNLLILTLVVMGRSATKHFSVVYNFETYPCIGWSLPILWLLLLLILLYTGFSYTFFLYIFPIHFPIHFSNTFFPL